MVNDLRDGLGTRTTPNQERMEALKQAVDLVFSDEQINLKTVLLPNQLIACTRLRIFAERYQSDMAFFILATLLQFAISLKARGRQDLEAVLKAALFSSEQAPVSLGLKQRMFGGM